MSNKFDNSERGGAGVKLLIVLLILGALAHAGYQYVPVAYEGENFKQEMHTAVVNAVAMPSQGKTPLDTVKEKVVTAVRKNQLPENTLIEVKPVNNVIQARVAYSKLVPILPFGLYTYTYVFDHTATPTGFLTKTD